MTQTHTLMTSSEIEFVSQMNIMGNTVYLIDWINVATRLSFANILVQQNATAVGVAPQTPLLELTASLSWF